MHNVHVHVHDDVLHVHVQLCHDCINMPNVSRVHAVAVPVPGCVPLLDLETDMRSLGIEGVAASDVLDVIEGYLGEGYGIASRELKGSHCDILCNALYTCGLRKYNSIRAGRH